MTIHEATQRLKFELFHIYDEREAQHIADWVMDAVTQWQKIDRVTHKTVPLTIPQQEQLQHYTEALMNHQPVQYVLHEAWFFGLRLYVNGSVLIPRPETEEMVDWLLQDFREAGHSKKYHAGANPIILDIGTGSGCIPLAIKKNLPAAHVHSCDISEDALAVAKKNAGMLDLTVTFHHADILTETQWPQVSAIDIIISNPPYVPQKDKQSMAEHVTRYEPSLALFVPDDDPLRFYKAIAVFAASRLAVTGKIFLEIYEALAREVTAEFAARGFTRIELKKDMQGKDRMLKIMW